MAPSTTGPYIITKSSFGPFEPKEQLCPVHPPPWKGTVQGRVGGKETARDPWKHHTRQTTREAARIGAPEGGLGPEKGLKADAGALPCPAWLTFPLAETSHTGLCW